MKSEPAVGMVIVDDRQVHFLITNTDTPFCQVVNLKTGTTVEVQLGLLRTFKVVAKNVTLKS